MKDKSIVFFGSTETTTIKREHSLVAKLDAIVDRLGIRNVVKGKDIAIKMHVGYKLGYSTVHPFLVGRLVRTVKNAGGRPYILDILDQIPGARLRGYAEEVIGCPILPVAGIKDNYFIEKEVNYKGVKPLKMGGNVKNADILINLSHVKGHNNAGFGAALKNLALGCFTQDSRGNMHHTDQYDAYWDSDKCFNPEGLVKACPYNLIKWENGKLMVDFGLCKQCMRCVQADKDGCLKIRRENFESFFEIMAMATDLVLSEIGKENCFNINVAFDITQYCDCWGATTGNILPDLGFLGSRDILAIDKATLDLLADKPLIKENVFKTSDINDDPDLHPFARLHGPYKDPYLQIKFGEKYNLGNPNYEIEEVLPPQKVVKKMLPKFPKALKIR